MIHLIEFTVTSENYILEAWRRKRDVQYQDQVKQLTDKGWTVKLHILPFGVRGFCPNVTRKGLTDLGLRRTEVTKLVDTLAVLMIRYGHKLLCTRRHLELSEEYRQHSGMARYQEYRLNKKKEGRAKRDAS